MALRGCSDASWPQPSSSALPPLPAPPGPHDAGCSSAAPGHQVRSPRTPALARRAAGEREGRRRGPDRRTGAPRAGRLRSARRPRGARPLSTSHRPPADVPERWRPRNGRQNPRKPGEARLSRAPPAAPAAHLGHLRPEVDVLEVDGAGGEVVQQLAQQDAVAQCLGQVEDHRRGPHEPVIGRQDLAVDEPAAAPLLHGARAGQGSGQSAAAEGIPPARAGLGGRGGASRAARGPAAPPRFPPPPAPAGLPARGSPLPPTCGRRVPPSHTQVPPGPGPGSTPPAPPGAAFCARGAPRPPPLLPRPETKARRVARSAPPAPRPAAPPPPRFVRRARGLRAPRLALRLGGSGTQGAGGARPGRRAGPGGGGAAGPGPAPPRPPVPVPPRVPAKVAEGGGRGAAGVRPRGGTLGEAPGPGRAARPVVARRWPGRCPCARLVARGSSRWSLEVAPVPPGAPACPFGKGRWAGPSPPAPSPPAPPQSRMGPERPQRLFRVLPAESKWIDFDCDRHVAMSITLLYI
ncbi:basic proline-rich protein-like [Choloepus didactylus]|uniref:basic proline-rich protein-like n=1 Tax=Choloepus didactylus TaxID=27675 RepID=UPI00189C92BB|nr:basic proline-rich protein-like [Choloepus didactylus]